MENRSRVLPLAERPFAVLRQSSTPLNKREGSAELRAARKGISAGVTRDLPPNTTPRFPTAERLAGVSENELRACGLGYRAPYLKAAARMHASGRIDPEKLKGLEDDALREALMEIPGIGQKVAECVMLFGYGRESAFPVDVWIARCMRRWYFRNRKVPDRKIREFARKHFGPYCGWAQQYLFHYSRKLGREGVNQVIVPRSARESASTSWSGRKERPTISSGRSAAPRRSPSI